MTSTPKGGEKQNPARRLFAHLLDLIGAEKITDFADLDDNTAASQETNRK